MKIFIAMIAVLLAAAGCTTSSVDWRAQLAKSCDAAKPVVAALDVLYDGGALGNNATKYQNARFVYTQACDGTITDVTTAAVKAATVYVLLLQISKAERNG